MKSYLINTLVIFYFLFFIYVVGFYHWRVFNINPLDYSYFHNPDKLPNFSFFDLKNDINQIKNEKILSIKPADFYYYNSTQVSYLNKDLKEFYLEDELIKSYNLLKINDINYVYKPNYELPPYTNSNLIDIISNINLSKLMFFKNGYSVFKLINNDNQNLIKINFNKLSIGTEIVIGGRKGIFKFNTKHFPFLSNYFGERSLKKFNEYQINLSDSINSNEILIDINFLKKKMFVLLNIEEYRDNELINNYQLDESIVDINKLNRSFRLIKNKLTNEIKLRVEAMGVDNKFVENIDFYYVND
tara:strand:+ start:1678 stop:2580 length:903 start_codon:yes stop_codon:yes gene_type:complete